MRASIQLRHLGRSMTQESNLAPAKKVLGQMILTRLEWAEERLLLFSSGTRYTSTEKTNQDAPSNLLPLILTLLCRYFILIAMILYVTAIAGLYFYIDRSSIGK